MEILAYALGIVTLYILIHKWKIYPHRMREYQKACVRYWRKVVKNSIGFATNAFRDFEVSLDHIRETLQLTAAKFQVVAEQGLITKEDVPGIKRLMEFPIDDPPIHTGIWWFT